MKFGCWLGWGLGVGEVSTVLLFMFIYGVTFTRANRGGGSSFRMDFVSPVNAGKECSARCAGSCSLGLLMNVSGSREQFALKNLSGVVLDSTGNIRITKLSGCINGDKRKVR